MPGVYITQVLANGKPQFNQQLNVLVFAQLDLGTNENFAKGNHFPALLI